MGSSHPFRGCLRRACVLAALWLPAVGSRLWTPSAFIITPTSAGNLLYSPSHVTARSDTMVNMMARGDMQTRRAYRRRASTGAGSKGMTGGLGGSVVASLYLRKPKRYLNSTEELVLIKATQKLKRAVNKRKELTLTLERQPTSGEWASALGMKQDEFQEELQALHQASQTLIRFNSNYIGSIVRKYKWLGVDSSDLYQEGVMGYLRAAELFDESRGCRLNTFAYRIVNQHVMTAAARSSMVVTMPTTTLQAFIKLNSLKNKYRREGLEDRDELMDRLSQDMKISRGRAEAMEKSTRPAMVSSNMREYVDSHRCRLVSEAEGTQSPNAHLGGMELRYYLEWALQQLDPTERDVIRMTKGLDDGVRRTPYQVARMLELRTRELMALESEAMGKLSKALTPILPQVMQSFQAADDYEKGFTSPFVHQQPAKINSI